MAAFPTPPFPCEHMRACAPHHGLARAWGSQAHPPFVPAPHGRAALPPHPLPRDPQKARRFVVSFYLADDTVSVYEVSDAAVGMQQGKFLDRGRYRKAHTGGDGSHAAAGAGGGDGGAGFPQPQHRRVVMGDRFGYAQVGGWVGGRVRCG